MTRFNLRYISDLGTEIEFTQFTDYLELPKGLSGFGMPPVTHQSIITPSRQGSLVTSTRHEALVLSIPILALRPNVDSLLSLIRTLGKAVDPLSGMGKLVFKPQNSAVEFFIPAYYNSGATVQDLGNPSAGGLKTTLEFLCPDPYWRGTSGGYTWLGAAANEGSHWFPMDPFPSLFSGGVIGETTIVNSGDVETFPIWTIVGAVSNPTIQNLDTLETIAFSTTLAAGEKIIVDTELATVTKIAAGVETNAFPLMTSYDLWTIPRGTTNVAISMSDSTASSYISVYWMTKRLAPIL